ncbi:MAG: hypothetical protein CML12_01560 [Puniceicoccaceae bacterium]|nr:hypothetical protein [Puniceicoccaceae bacterium]
MKLLSRFKKRLSYSRIKAINFFHSVLNSRLSNLYLFILSPPFSGSTLLNEIIDRSESVSCNNPYGTKEGQFLPEIKPLLWNEDNFNPDLDVDWDYIKKVWSKYWNLSKPVLLEKSPSNLVRAKSIEKHFEGVHFVCLVRDPYALVEGFLRRSIIYKTPKDAAGFVIKCFKHQKDNLECLHYNLLVKYEDIVESSEDAVKRLVEFVPALHPISTEGEFEAHNIKGEASGIHNFNLEKVERLNQAQLDEINSVFDQHAELIQYFGYSVYSSRAELLEGLSS